ATGTINVTGNGQNPTINGLGTVNNAGIINVDLSGIFQIATFQFNNTGTVNINSGTFSLTAINSSNNGTINVASGTSFSGLSPTPNIVNNATINFAGTVSSTPNIKNNGILNYNFGTNTLSAMLSATSQINVGASSLTLSAVSGSALTGGVNVGL